MDEEMNEKYNLMLKIERYERALIELSNWSPQYSLSASTEKITGKITDENTRDKWIETLEDIRSITQKEKKVNTGKLYLSEIIEKENIKFNSNSLILAPTGSGKTYFMRSLINVEKVLLLVSTTSLKDKFVPNSENIRKELGNRMHSTKRKNVYGDGCYEITVMTYAEFGEKIKYTDSFANEFGQIFCDEIHSLFHYYTIGFTDTLLVAIRYLFSKRENQDKYYFTATDEYLTKFKKESKELFQNVSIFNYLEHPNIIKHMTLSSYKINGLEQVRPHLKARKDSFNYFKYKVFAFCKTIESQKYLKNIMEEEGFKPLVLWSVNNEKKVMTKEQLKQRDYILRTGLIPDEYNALIVNSSMQEGWDLLDPKVKLVIMNTINETELVQAIGRVRQDIDLLVYRVKTGDADYFVEFPQNLIDVPLSVQMKDELCENFNIKNQNGRLLKWRSIKPILEKQGFIIEEKVVKFEGKSTRVSVVNYSEIVI